MLSSCKKWSQKFWKYGEKHMFFKLFMNCVCHTQFHPRPAEKINPLSSRIMIVIKRCFKDFQVLPQVLNWIWTLTWVL